MSHRARRSRAEAPDDAVELAAGEVRRAFSEWAARFVALVVRDLAPSVASQRQDATLLSNEVAALHGSRLSWRTDATVEGLYREVGRARPRAEKLEQAFRMLDKQSADELRVTGVATADVIPKAEARKQEWLRANTDLIKAEADLRRRVERVIQDPLNQGRSVADIAKLLEEQAGYSTSRAALTARDQTLKLYGQVQQERQQNAGVERYVWTTSLDERVRPDHADLDGTVQRWDDPPIVDQRTGRRGHPGFDFQCRCTAVAILDDEPTEGEAPAEQRRQNQLRERAVAEGRAAPPRPPREPEMRPSQAELEAARARVEAERRAQAARLQAEREADARIAAARAATAQVEVAAPVATDGTRIDITQLDHRALDADKFRPGVLEALRADPNFVATGKATVGAERNARIGTDRLLLRQRSPDGKGPLKGTGWYLVDGSHRLQVARELGLLTLPARVLNAAGEEIWRGQLPIGRPGSGYDRPSGH